MTARDEAAARCRKAFPDLEDASAEGWEAIDQIGAFVRARLG